MFRNSNCFILASNLIIGVRFLLRHAANQMKHLIDRTFCKVDIAKVAFNFHICKEFG